jgi:hypothetical protein
MFRRILLLLVALGLLVSVGRWLHLQLAYAEIERLTEQYGDALAMAINQTVMEVQHPMEGYSQSLEYFKVFDVSDTHAKVFVVIQLKINRPGLPASERSGEFYHFVFQNGQWISDPSQPREVVWSDYGSADGETWPPYR